MKNFTCERKLGIFVRIRNIDCVAGTIRLFSYKGPTLLTFYQEGLTEGWAVRTVLNCYLFALIHISQGKSDREPGLFINWASLSLKKKYKGYTLELTSADTFDVHPRRLNKKRKVKFNVG